jgi:hypothetical protein
MSSAVAAKSSSRHVFACLGVNSPGVKQGGPPFCLN